MRPFPCTDNNNIILLISFSACNFLSHSSETVHHFVLNVTSSEARSWSVSFRLALSTIASLIIKTVALLHRTGCFRGTVIRRHVDRFLWPKRSARHWNRYIQVSRPRLLDYWRELENSAFRANKMKIMFTVDMSRPPHWGWKEIKQTWQSALCVCLIR